MGARKRRPPLEKEREFTEDLRDALETGARLDDVEEYLGRAFDLLAVRSHRQTLATLTSGLLLALLASVALVLTAAALFHWLVPVILGVILLVLLVIFTLFGGSLLLLPDLERLGDDAPDDESEE